jgi:hypothetical protein
MKKAHEIISNLPYFIVGYWVLFYIIGKCGFYHKSFLLLDLIDFAPVCVSVFHFILNFVFNWVVYNKSKIVLICTIIAISGMYKLRYSIDDNIYWVLYLSTLFGGIAIALLTYFISRK